MDFQRIDAESNDPRLGLEVTDVFLYQDAPEENYVVIGVELASEKHFRLVLNPQLAASMLTGLAKGLKNQGQEISVFYEGEQVL